MRYKRMVEKESVLLQSFGNSFVQNTLLSDRVIYFYCLKLFPLQDFSGPVLGFDPLPPKDSVNIYTRPKRPMVASSNSSIPLGIFFRSILPNFNPNQIPPNLLDV